MVVSSLGGFFFFKEDVEIGRWGPYYREREKETTFLDFVYVRVRLMYIIE